MTLKFVEKDSGEVSLTTFIGKADPRPKVFGEIIFMLFTGFMLIAYVAHFSVKKFRRVKEEKLMF